jgi:hypothetical protein
MSRTISRSAVGHIQRNEKCSFWSSRKRKSRSEITSGGEAVTAFSQDLHQVVSQVASSQIQTEDGVGQSVTYWSKNISNLSYRLRYLFIRVWQTFVDGDGVGDTITRVQNDTGCTRNACYYFFFFYIINYYKVSDVKKLHPLLRGIVMHRQFHQITKFWMEIFQYNVVKTFK